MSEPNQEPTMEEILASIRRIISEDEAPAEAAEPEAAAEPEEEPVEALDMETEDFAPEAVEDDVLELTERIGGPEPSESLGDLDVYAAEAEEPEPMARAPAPAPVQAYDADDEGPLLGDAAAQSASSAFGRLARGILMPADGRTLEDVVRELLRPLLKEWLDENLPAIVQARVDAEVERISRQYRG
jgi:cell pole-organizing protein PopZ